MGEDGDASPPRSLSKLRYDGTRTEIIATAERLFIEQGLRNTSMADVAGAVGIGRPSLYHYFSSKEELVDATCVMVTGRFRPFDELPEQTDLAEGLGYVVTRLFESLAGQRRDLRFIMLAMIEQVEEPQERQSIRIAMRSFWAAIREVIRRGQVAGEVAPTIDLDDAANQLLSGVLGLEYLWLIHPEFDAQAAAKRLEVQFCSALADASRWPAGPAHA